MNKKIVLSCGLVALATLGSCNQNKFTRDAFKEVSQDEFIDKLKLIQKNAIPANLNNKGKVAFTNTIKHRSIINNLLYWNVNYTRNISYEWSNDDNYIKITYDVSGKYDYYTDTYWVIDAKESYTAYLKKLNGIYYIFDIDNIAGVRYKYKANDEISNMDVKTVIKTVFDRDHLMYPMYYDTCETLAKKTEVLTLSDGFILPDIYGDYFLYEVYLNKDIYEHYIGNNKGDCTVKFGSNDKESASYSLNGQVTASNYIKMMQGEYPAGLSNPTGNANLDFYFSFKNNVFSQAEYSVKYDINYDAVYKEETRKQNCINDCYFNFQSTLDSCTPDTIDPNQYILI